VGPTTITGTYKASGEKGRDNAQEQLFSTVRVDLAIADELARLVQLKTQLLACTLNR
jgi:hypothetical protein